MVFPTTEMPHRANETDTEVDRRIARTSTMFSDTDAQISDSNDESRSSKKTKERDWQDRHRQVLNTSLSHTAAATADPKLATKKWISLRDIPFGIAMIDALVGKDESLHQRERYYEQGTFRCWQHLLKQNSGSDYIQGIEVKDTSDRRSMELHLHDEHSEASSCNGTKRTWLPTSLLTSGDGRSDEGTSLLASSDQTPNQLKPRRKKWYKRPELLKRRTVSEKPRPMQMVFFDAAQLTTSSSEELSEIEYDC